MDFLQRRSEAYIFRYVEPLRAARTNPVKSVPARWGRMGETIAMFIGREEQKG
jgi:hypothetical protein